MPSSSESQRKLFGLVLAVKRGQTKSSSYNIRKMANTMNEDTVKEFASKKRRQGVHKSLMDSTY